MICFDEFGPMEIKPYGGSGWYRKTKPKRLPATYNRTQGVKQLLAGFDLGKDKIYAHVKDRKRWPEVLAFLKYLRTKYPDYKRLYIVLDNFSPHIKLEVKAWAKKNKVTLVYTPTNASWLNRIECHFAPIRKFVFAGSNYANHHELALALRKYIRWRNKNTKHPKILKAQNKVKVL